MEENSSVSDLNALVGTSGDDDDMTLSVLREGRGVTVVVKGEIDLMTVARLSDTLSSELAAAPPVLVVDLDGVGFLASMGITTLALAEREAAQRRIDFRVVASGRTTLRPLQITGMTDLLDVYPSRSEALSAGGSCSRPQQGH
ncbi:MAG TPA: STAS domain-containing protein [Pseudonocardia sp.]|jgi:anti-anti-sigma factor|nr:STAS domain-containing protein [Pseudonocardia sp.]